MIPGDDPMDSHPHIPAPVTTWLERWRLVPDGALLTTHSSWVLPVRHEGRPAMLKVARIPDEGAGYRLLTWWDGQGAAEGLCLDCGRAADGTGLGSR